MPTLWGNIYSRVCTVLLEDGGATAGDFTESEFLTLAGEVLTDFASKTGLNRKIYNWPIQQGVGIYPQPPAMGELLSAMAWQGYLQESSDFYLSNLDPYWENQIGTPYSYRQDSLPSQQIQIEPAPITTGSQVLCLNVGFGQIGAASSFVPLTANGYGTFSSSTSGIFFNTTPSNPWPGYGYGWGLPCGFTGTVIVTSVNNGYGTVGVFSLFLNNQECGCNGQSYLANQDFWITTDPSTPKGYGTCSGFLGNPYFDSVNQGYGVLSVMIPSFSNLSMFGVALPWNITNLTLTTYVEGVPDLFTPYLKYAILEKLFSNDAETKDSQKAAYCRARRIEGQNMLAALLEQEEEE